VYSFRRNDNNRLLKLAQQPEFCQEEKMKGVSINKDTKNRFFECLWTQAGVVQHKVCHSDFQCISCQFDKAMTRVSEKNRRFRKQGLALKGRGGRIVFWKEKMREKPPGKRPCLHSMKGRIQFRLCINNYQCGNCEFDQYFNDQHIVHAVVKHIDVTDIHGFKIPQGYYLHRGHSWIKVEEDSEVRVGMDDFSLRMLGPLDEIKAPLLGKVVTQGNKSIHLRRGNKEATIVSPVSGIVTALNPDMLSSLKKKGHTSYTDGWVMRIHTDSLRENLKSLMIGDEAESFLSEEIDALYQFIEAEKGPLAADGGQLGHDIYGNLPESSWERLITRFL
jgi:glycine cleavage system H lipoate-binding protein